MIEGKRIKGKQSFNTKSNYKIKDPEGFGLILVHGKVIQKEKKWAKTSKSPMFRGGFQVLYMRWQVQKLVFVTPADMIDQKYHSKQMTQRQKCSKTAVEVEKKVTAFGKNIRPGQCQPYISRLP